jgi:hypothetical protein
MSAGIMSPPSECRWFLHCTNMAVDTVAHPILGDVPVCESCKAFTQPRTYLD